MENSGLVPYDREPLRQQLFEGAVVASFVSGSDTNMDAKTVASFGQEWDAFDHFSEAELSLIGNEYFDIVGASHIGPQSTVLDVGCGTGRWSRYIAGRAGFVEAIDPSSAVFNAIQFNRDIPNIRFSQAGTDSIPFADGRFDLVFSLGVLHHIPDTQKAMEDCVKKVKIGGHFLVYLYYNFDNRGRLYKLIFQCSNLLRRMICRMPFGLKKATCNLIAFFIYLPLAKSGAGLKSLFPARTFYRKLPLFYYHDKTFHVMRNDSLDRFGTPLEQRFSKAQITEMMQRCGLEEIVFSNKTPFWHAIGKRTR